MSKTNAPPAAQAQAEATLAEPGWLSRKSRRAGLAALAGACMAAGVWRAWPPAPGADAPADAPSAQDPWERFWASRFALLSGGEQAASAWRGKPLVLNFWATWCPPCIEEMPMLSDFYAQNKKNGWQMIAFAADSQEKVTAFLAKQPVQMPVSVLGASAISLSKDMGNLTGGLPFTVVLSSNGSIAQRKSGQLKPADLAAWLSLV